MTGMLAGVDLASWQGTPGQWQPEAGNITWAAVKLTELQPAGGRYVNPAARADWAALKASRAVRVAYLYARPSQPADDAVALFLSVLRPLGLDDGDGVAIDLEETDGLPPGRVDAWAARTAALLEKELGRVPLLYTYLSFAGAGNCASLGRLPLWISDPSSPPGKPRIPAPWRHWTVHQYSVTGPVDRDLAAARLPAVIRRRPPARPALEDDMPNGILLSPGPTPIRVGENGPWTELLLSVSTDVSKDAPAELVVSVLDTDGVYEQDCAVAWRTPGVVTFRHGNATKAVSVARKDAGTGPVAWMLK